MYIRSTSWWGTYAYRRTSRGAVRIFVSILALSRPVQIKYSPALPHNPTYYRWNRFLLLLTFFLFACALRCGRPCYSQASGGCPRASRQRQYGEFLESLSIFNYSSASAHVPSTIDMTHITTNHVVTCTLALIWDCCFLHPASPRIYTDVPSLKPHHECCSKVWSCSLRYEISIDTIVKQFLLSYTL